MTRNRKLAGSRARRFLSASLSPPADHSRHCMSTMKTSIPPLSCMFSKAKIVDEALVYLLCVDVLVVDCAPEVWGQEAIAEHAGFQKERRLFARVSLVHVRAGDGQHFCPGNAEKVLRRGGDLLGV
ncbi:hypothetical protein EJ02DRAFT_262981 [Clathrospora elynae]|uniref:Uncharacterized protein n=1 Tax=Clathrospora elynae TaxID=706981 RepID=A0A6A5T376_9PLEO|nr:hypothetical protein EJ02DRAFT_262981 [Clathrospora elynae]